MLITEVLSLLDNLLTEHFNNAKYSDKYYITEKEFMELIGLKRARFYELKKQGKFEKAMHPATRGGLRVKYHKYFNRLTNKIELPELKTCIENYILPIEYSKIFLSFLDNLLTEHFNNAKSDEYYITEKEFRNLLGLGSTKFYELKKQGKFKKAMLLIKSGTRIKYHKYFNVFTNKIELPGLNRPHIEQPKRQTSKTLQEDICQ